MKRPPRRGRGSAGRLPECDFRVRLTAGRAPPMCLAGRSRPRDCRCRDQLGKGMHRKFPRRSTEFRSGRAYAVRCAGNDLAFFDFLSRMNVAYDELVSGRWPVVGNMKLTDMLAQPAAYWNQPVGSNDLFIYRQGRFQPARHEDVRGLEPLIIWFQSHSEERLRDHFEGRPNRAIQCIFHVRCWSFSSGTIGLSRRLLVPIGSGQILREPS